MPCHIGVGQHISTHLAFSHPPAGPYFHSFPANRRLRFTYITGPNMYGKVSPVHPEIKYDEYNVIFIESITKSALYYKDKTRC